MLKKTDCYPWRVLTGVVGCHPVRVLLQPLARCSFAEENKCMYTLKARSKSFPSLLWCERFVRVIHSAEAGCSSLLWPGWYLFTISSHTQNRVKDDCFCILCRTWHVCIVASQGRDRVEGFIYWSEGLRLNKRNVKFSGLSCLSLGTCSLVGHVPLRRVSAQDFASLCDA